MNASAVMSLIIYLINMVFNLCLVLQILRKEIQLSSYIDIRIRLTTCTFFLVKIWICTFIFDFMLVKRMILERVLLKYLRKILYFLSRVAKLQGIIFISAITFVARTICNCKSALLALKPKQNQWCLCDNVMLDLLM